jgi:hypothetical protein
MKAVFEGKINFMHRRDDDGEVRVELQMRNKGSVIDAPQNAKETEVFMTLYVKPVVADQLKIGSVMRITVEELV